MREIGSEYWQAAPTDPAAVPFWESWPGEKAFFVSGRTALYAILQDIAQTRGARRAYLPSYCCESMIEPFARAGLTVAFYPVRFADGGLRCEIDADHACDVILCMDYFGFSGPRPALPPTAMVIRDYTHALLCTDVPDADADYGFASFRKWGAVAGAAIAYKRGGRFAAQSGKAHTAYLALREGAYARKAAYMAGETGEKGEYLALFHKAEDLLRTDYAGYAADPDSLACAGALRIDRQARRDNAATLLAGLRDVGFAQPIFATLAPGDAPLFVPLRVPGGRREALRQYLIDHSVYCPVHWPLSALHTICEPAREIYMQEISLLCDQRYTPADMRRELDVIRDFEKTNV